MNQLDTAFADKGGASNYLQGSKQNGEWGDGIMISLASLLYDKQIIIYHPKSKPIMLRD